MSADVLRQAARLMRELADKAAAQPVIKANVEGVWLNSRFYMVTTPDRERAVADWLEAEASAHSDGDGEAFWFDVDPANIAACCRMPEALAVAHAYLGTP